MKKLMVLIAILAMVLSAGTVLAADDVDIDINNANTNSVNATGGNATVTNSNTNNNTMSQTATGTATSDSSSISGASSDNSFVSTTEREFLAPPGFVGFVNPGTPLESGEWENAYCPDALPSLSIDEIERMKGTLEFADFWAWNWERRVRMTQISEPMPPKKKDARIYCTNYWPMDMPLSGDQILGIVKIKGEPEWSREAFRAKADEQCFEVYSSTRVPIRFKERKDGVTIGKSLGLSSAISEVSGDKGVAFAAGGQLGTNRTRVEEYPEVEALCMNNGGYTRIVQQTASTVVEKHPEVKKLEPSCDAGQFDKQLDYYDQEILWCKYPGRNNQGLRFGKGNAKLDKYFCEGRKNKQLLLDAIYEYGVAERDYNNGRELTASQSFGERPMGVKTTTLSEARELDYKVHYNWALAIRELNESGVADEVAHAHKYKLDKFGTRDMPSEWKDMKR